MYTCNNKVAILMATYNGERFLRSQLDSILNQDYLDYKLYIHDDGSTDNTVNILNEYQKRYPEKIVICQYNSPKGPSNNFLSLLMHVNADYYLFCDQDDVWKPYKLTFFAKEIDKGNELLLVYSNMHVSDCFLNIYKNNYFESKDIVNQLSFGEVLIQGIVPGCNMMISRKIRDIALQYKNYQNIFMHDWWLLIIAKGCNATIKYIETPTMYYRQHENNVLGSHEKSIMHLISNLIMNGYEEIKKKKAWAKRPYNFAKECCNISEIISENRNFCVAYCNIFENGNKLTRISFYLKHYRTLDNYLLRLLFI